MTEYDVPYASCSRAQIDHKVSLPMVFQIVLETRTAMCISYQSKPHLMYREKLSNAFLPDVAYRIPLQDSLRVENKLCILNRA